MRLCMVNLSSHGASEREGETQQTKAGREQEMVHCDRSARRARESQLGRPMAAGC